MHHRMEKVMEQSKSSIAAASTPASVEGTEEITITGPVVVAVDVEDEE
ncbi:hypothetical protein ACFYOD_33980 [Streptomyces sp. NPDC006703]